MIEDSKRIGMQQKSTEARIDNGRSFRILNEKFQTLFDPLNESSAGKFATGSAIVGGGSKVGLGLRTNDEFHQSARFSKRSLTSAQDDPGSTSSLWRSKRSSSVRFCSSVTGSPSFKPSSSSHNSPTKDNLSAALSCWMSGNLSAITAATLRSARAIRKIHELHRKSS